MKKHNFKRINNRNNSESPLKEILISIRNAKSLKDVFVPEKYALPGGWAEITAMTLSKKGNKNEGMNNHQLRKIFTEIKNIESDIRRDEKKFQSHKNRIFMLMPQVAYALGRNVIPRDFYELMKECINPEKIKYPDDYYSFVDYFTSIVAYFKALTNEKK